MNDSAGCGEPAGRRGRGLRTAAALSTFLLVAGCVPGAAPRPDSGAPRKAASAPADDGAGSSGGRESGGLGDFLSDGGPDLECLTPEEGESDLPGGDRDRGLGAQVQSISARVEELRGLEFKEPVDAKLLSDAAIERRVGRLMSREYSDELADSEQRILSALGAIPRATNLKRTRTQLLAGQVAGFYVPRTGELVVRSGASEELPVIDRITLAHELEHALADQRLALPDDEAPPPGEEDSHLAALSVVEGDATLTMQRYATTLSLGERLSLLADPALARGATEGLDGVPHYLQQELTFPYLAGSRFVCSLYKKGGWRSVNHAYAKPPPTTAQVLFPERYGAGGRVKNPHDPGVPGPDWKPQRRQSLGAANLLWLLEAPGGDAGRAIEDPLGAVEQWAGGELELWVRGRHTAVGIALEGRGATGMLCDGVTEWYDAAWTQDGRIDTPRGSVFPASDSVQHAVVKCRPGEVRVGIAPNGDAARRLAQVAPGS